MLTITSYTRETAMDKSKFITTIISLCALALTVASTATQAQAQFGAGGGYNFKRESLMLEGRFAIPLNPKLKLVPQLAVDFEIDELVLDVDGHYILNPGTALYLLGGLNYANDDAGLNLGGGLSVDFTPKTKGYLELKYVAFGWDGWIFKAGVMF
jgi:hypothetical protein